MFAYPYARRALLCGLAAISLTACDSANPLGAGSASAQAQPEQVSRGDLQAAVDDAQSRRFYEATNWAAAWNDEQERQLIDALDDASVHALSRNFFLDGELPGDPAAREAALTKAALKFASALATGYTDPTELREVYTLDRPTFDAAAGLAEAVKQGKVGAWLNGLAPQSAEYRALSDAFVKYLKRAENGQDRAIAAGDAIHAGDRDPRVPQIAQALAESGYLPAPADSAAFGQTFTPQMADALKALQADFGIKADGVVGSGTLSVLNAGATERARQLAVNLERLRWLARDVPATRIDVNTAATMLYYWRDGQLKDERRVVVGEPGWETPQLGSPMFRLVANPTWTVPKSIEEDELADKGPGYFAENNMVRRDGWIVQLPGPENALGEVKFDLKNDQAIYLHDTPAKALFAQNERHRSHGCIRVHNALQFAQLIARDSGVLPQFQEAMATGEEKFVNLDRNIPVRLLYHTAFVDPAGKVRFRTDPYGWDEDVARALGREARTRRQLESHNSGRDIGP